MLDNALKNKAKKQLLRQAKPKHPSLLPKDSPQTKGQRTQERILRSAIHCLAHLGFDRTTFQAIADHCGISQPLVVHYFKKKENVFPAVVKYLTQRTHDVIASEISRESSPTERLCDFVRVSLNYARKEQDEARIFLTLSFLSAFDTSYRPSNVQIKQLVLQELTDILIDGVRTGEFVLEQVSLSAKLISSYIMGVRMNMLNEEEITPDAAMISVMENHCLKIVGAKISKK